jgi:DNA-binding IclR family transcriptional regulator
MDVHAQASQQALGSAVPSPAVLRAGAILRALAEAEGESLTVGRLAAAIGAPRSSTMNICAALAELQFVSPSRGGYTLGRGLVELAHSFIDTFAPVQGFLEACRSAAPALEATAQLATLDGCDVVYLARHDGAQLIRIASRVGGRLPANCTGLGKAMLASLRDDDLTKVLATFPDPLPQMTEASISEVSVLRQELDVVRAEGFAVDAEETTPGIVCVAVPLAREQRLDQVYAVSASILRVQATPEKIATTVETLKVVAARTAGL